MASLSDFQRSLYRCGYSGLYCLIRYSVSSVDRYSEGAMHLFRFESNNSQICLMMAKRSVFQNLGLSSALPKQRWLRKNQKQISDNIELKPKWLSGENVSSKYMFTPSNPLNYKNSKNCIKFGIVGNFHRHIFMYWFNRTFYCL